MLRTAETPDRLAPHREPALVRAIVTGGRHFNDYAMLERAMDRAARIYGVGFVITGSSRTADEIGSSYRSAKGALRGVDDVALCWAKRRGLATENYPADWKGLGRGAGPERNKRMLEHSRPNLVLAFPGGRGTAHMCRISIEAEIPVYEWHEERWSAYVGHLLA
jgi:hypothetical protein